jgi:hypothetical protein
VRRSHPRPSDRATGNAWRSVVSSAGATRAASTCPPMKPMLILWAFRPALVTLRRLDDFGQHVARREAGGRDGAASAVRDPVCVTHLDSGLARRRRPPRNAPSRIAADGAMEEAAATRLPVAECSREPSSLRWGSSAPALCRASCWDDRFASRAGPANVVVSDLEQASRAQDDLIRFVRAKPELSHQAVARRVANLLKNVDDTEQ